jgi:hypothetical protein
MDPSSGQDIHLTERWMQVFCYRRSSLRLLEEFRLFVDGEVIALPHSAERVVAFLGMSPAPVGRVRLATTLWPDVVVRAATWFGSLR